MHCNRQYNNHIQKPSRTRKLRRPTYDSSVRTCSIDRWPGGKRSSVPHSGSRHHKYIRPINWQEMLRVHFILYTLYHYCWDAVLRSKRPRKHDMLAAAARVVYQVLIRVISHSLTHSSSFSAAAPGSCAASVRQETAAAMVPLPAMLERSSAVQISPTAEKALPEKFGSTSGSR